MVVPAVILAGGYGMRLREAVNDRPKPMADAGGRPFLEYILGFLRDSGVKEIILCVSYMADYIINHFQDGEKLGLDIRYSVEDEPLGTGGALKLVSSIVKPPFLAMNGDTYFEVNIKELIETHIKKNADCTMAVKELKEESRYGRVILDDEDRVKGFAEKDYTSDSPWINGGVMVIGNAVAEAIPSQKKMSFEAEIMPLLTDKGLKIYAYKSEGYFKDIGIKEAYFEFLEWIKNNNEPSK